MSKSEQIKQVNPWMIFLVVTIGTFMVNVDSSIINVALPTLQTVFGVKIGQLQWVIVVYLLIITGILPFIGKLSDQNGRKKFFITGVAIFIIASIGSAFAVNLGMLITTRGLQSFGAAMIMGNVMGIVANVFPPGQRGKALGTIGSVVAAGTIVGPSLGGFLIDQFGWRAIFMINVPLGLISIIGSIALLPPLVPEHKIKAKYDFSGALLFFLAMSTLLFQISNGATIGWTSPIALTIIGISFIAWISFIYTERKAADPMIDLQFFKNARFTINVIGNYAFYYLMMSTYVLLPLFYHNVLHLPVFHIGLLMTPQAIVMIIASPLSGWLSDRIGTLIPSLIGISIITVDLFFMSRFNETTSYTEIIIFMAIIGLGFAMFSSPNNVSIIDSLPTEKSGIAGSLVATSRNFGQVTGTAVGILILNYGLSIFNNNYVAATKLAFTISVFIGAVTLLVLASQFLLKPKVT